MNYRDDQEWGLSPRLGTVPVVEPSPNSELPITNNQFPIQPSRHWSLVIGYWLFAVAACIGLSSPLNAQEPLTNKEGELSAAMSGGFQPFSTTDESGNLTGFDHDIAVAVAERMGLTPVPVQTEWGGIFQGLQQSKYDLIVGSVEITDERRQTMDFSLPYYVSGTQVFAKPGLASLEGTRVGVTEATTYADYIEAHPEQFPNAEVIYYGSEAEIIAAIKTDKIDAFVSDRIVAQWYINERNADVEPFGEILKKAPIGICAKLDSPEMIRRVNQALFQIVTDGTYSRIYRKWIGSAPDLKTLMESWGEMEHDRQHGDGAEEGASGGEADEKPGFAQRFDQWIDLFIRGAILTLKLGLITAILALLLGTVIGVASTSSNVLIKKLAQGYILVVRGTPLLVQLFIAYYGIATLFNEIFTDGGELMGAFGAALLALVVNTGAYNAETIRGGILSVDKGQWEAAASLGMSRTSTLKRVILPQAFRNSVSSLGNNLVVLIKDTSLVGVITLIELTFTARNIVFQTGDPFLPFLVAAVFYLVIITVLDQGVKLWERRMMRSTGGKGATA